MVGREPLVPRPEGTYVRIIVLSHPVEPSSTRENTTHSERQTHFCDAPDTSTISSSRRLQYLVRHKVIALILQLALAFSGAEFYP